MELQKLYKENHISSTPEHFIGMTSDTRAADDCTGQRNISALLHNLRIQNDSLRESNFVDFGVGQEELWRFFTKPLDRQIQTIWCSVTNPIYFLKEYSQW